MDHFPQMQPCSPYPSRRLYHLTTKMVRKKSKCICFPPTEAELTKTQHSVHSRNGNSGFYAPCYPEKTFQREQMGCHSSGQEEIANKQDNPRKNIYLSELKKQSKSYLKAFGTVIPFAVVHLDLLRALFYTMVPLVIPHSYP